MIRVRNEDYRDTVVYMAENGWLADVVLTSPPYNTNKKQGKSVTLRNFSDDGKSFPYVRYDTVQDCMTQDEYCGFLVEFARNMGLVLKENGVILLNLSYGNENPDGMWLAVAEIIRETEFTVSDCIVWEKSHCIPNNNSRNRADRICEFVFVLARKTELCTYHANKIVKSHRKSGQPVYSNFRNKIKARNTDGPCPLNKACFSTDMAEKLLGIYAPDDGLVYDPFMGSGTTLAACKAMGLSAIGSEISESQCEWAERRINDVQGERTDDE